MALDMRMVVKINRLSSVNTETLSANKTLVVADYAAQWLDPGGSDRDITLPAEAASESVMFLILNDADGAGEDLVVKNDAPSTIATLGPGMSGIFSCDGTDWKWENDSGVFYDSISDYIQATALENTPVGQTTPAAGAFTILKASTDPTDEHGVGDRGYTDQRYSLNHYGVKWDGATSACIRTGALTSVAASSSPGDALLPIQSAMRRCIMNDAGQVVYYLDPTDSYNRLGFTPSIIGTDDVGTANKVSDTGVFTLAAAAYVGKYVHNTTDDTYSPITAKDSNDVLSIADDIMDLTEEFEICTAGVAYGGDGQVMDQIRAFEYRFSVDGDGYPNWDISTTPFDGSSIHPAFIKNGVFVPYRYASAFEGSMYDASVGAMVSSANIVTGMYAHGDKLCSLAGEFPKTNETRAEFRGMAAQRGNDWRQYDYDLMSAIQLLYLIEYADFNSQSMIGDGRTAMSGGSWVADSYIGKCGKSLGDGNGTASVGGNTNAAYMSYRGIENFYGNVWKWADGINVNDHIPYVSNIDSDFQDDTSLNYTDLNVTMPASNNYQQTLLSQGRGFLPATVGATTTKITDYYYQNTGWRVVRVGGGALNGAHAGAFCMHANNASSHVHVSISGRLAC